jgi:hypothetical protein
MICIQITGAAIFFPDEEITEIKAITTGGLPAIAFKSAGTGGLQFVKQFKTDSDRDAAIETVNKAKGAREETESPEDILIRRIEATEEALAEMRSKQKHSGQKKAKKPAGKQAGKKKEKTFLPPTEEEIISYIKEKKIDESLGIDAETIAESFRSTYESDEPTGEKDENGFTIYKWKKANGDPVQDWKGCLRTFKARQLVWSAKEKAAGTKPKTNQFNAFEQNSYSDEELEEIENSSVV